MRCAVFVTGASVFLCLVAASPDDEATQAELKKFEGTWKFESLEREGVKVPPEVYKRSELVLKGNAWTMNEPQATSKGTFTVDVTKKPKTIDVTFGEGPSKGAIMNGIYTLEGDTYTVCFSPIGKPRPTELSSTKGTGIVLEVLKRMK